MPAPPGESPFTRLNSIFKSKLRPAILIYRLQRERGLALPLEMLRISAQHPCCAFQFQIKNKEFFIWNWNNEESTKPKRTPKPIRFPAVKGRKIEAVFSGQAAVGRDVDRASAYNKKIRLPTGRLLARPAAAPRFSGGRYAP